MNQIHDFDKLWDYNNPAATEIKFREILSSLNKNDNVSGYLQLKTQIARTLGLQMKFDEAHKMLNEVESSLSPDLPIAEIRYLLERGRTFRSSGKTENSRQLFLKAFELSTEAGEESYAIDAAHMLGIIEPFKEAQEWNERAIKIASNSGEERSENWLGSLLNNTAWNYFDNKDYDKALALFEKNVEWHQKKNSVQKLLIAKWSVARTFRALDRTDEAIEMQLNLIKEIKEKGLEEDGYIYEELAELNLIKKNTEEVKKYSSKAFEILSKDIWLAENEKDRLLRLKELGSQ